MSSAKKCDRCGNFYSENETRPRKWCGKVVPNGVNMSIIVAKTNRNETDECFDLCDSCWDDFYKFMEDN